ncbi:MAG: chromate efflux transporter [Acidobacteria bacterium]|nr:chromate efflux transporter [Acidobacteriota bacterium]MCA1637364.1 chromate efflux transporter [Acidobacteriota bacterium]
MKEEDVVDKKVSFSEAFRFWVKLGFISFGGPAGQIAIMQRELVENRKWIDQDDFLHALNYCMLLPGPEAQQLATYIGWRLHGIRGGIVAGAFFVIPSIFFLLILSYVYAAYGNLPQIDAILDGFKAVVVAIVVEAVIKIGKKAFKSNRHIFIAILSFAAIYFFHVPFPLIVFGAAIIGVSSLKSQASTFSSDEQLKNESVEIKTKDKGQRTKNKTYFFKTILTCLFLWIVPFVLLLSLFGYENLLTKTYLFFTQAAFVTFGGAYAVLAYVNQAVVSAGWITAAQSVDGLALAETTPGPLIMVLQFVGFMTGWNNPALANQTLSATLSALLATYTTFLPSFFFIFLGAPYIEKLRHNAKLNSALSGVTAAVVGVILNLAIMFGVTVIFPDLQTDIFALGLAILSFAALYFLKADVLWVVIGGGLCGLAKYFLVG